MHKMELGDSVYAAERIMKKRIRKRRWFSGQERRRLDSEGAATGELANEALRQILIKLGQRGALRARAPQTEIKRLTEGYASEGE
ncbi:hypothetical protein EVAR_20800_1 [Eumeta japonica]|uniref:Uncharacterized protein n=1 Tax=Eumeta variegata TaxID=151549 RepID=A0A4C1UEV6_EUMVA|nr:hypothetical protein EVAR_20800_1 [Eumeta japonica]